MKMNMNVSDLLLQLARPGDMRRVATTLYGANAVLDAHQAAYKTFAHTPSCEGRLGLISDALDSAMEEDYGSWLTRRNPSLDDAERRRPVSTLAINVETARIQAVVEKSKGFSTTVFRDIDPGYAELCKTVYLDGLDWVVANPFGPGWNSLPDW